MLIIQVLPVIMNIEGTAGNRKTQNKSIKLFFYLFISIPSSRWTRLEFDTINQPTYIKIYLPHSFIYI